uniref:hypothetical protein n=1 Tax=uncultured Sphingomonas sp. TaxID=158754 RepID=UPI0035CA3A9C
MSDIATPPSQSFGRWLLAKKEDYTLADELAFIARDSPKFPRDASPDEVGTWLKAQGARGDVYKALDAAEWEWKGEAA